MPKGKRKGEKQSVQTYKKRKGFHGIRKQDKLKQVRLSEASPITSITFVHDEDVVADRLPETPISAAEKKIREQDADFSSDEEDYNGLEDAEGYRFIAISSLRDTLNRIHSSSGQCEGTVQITEDTNCRYGLSSSFFITCSSCKLQEFFSTGEHDLKDQCSRTNQGRDINRRIVYAAAETGLGRENIAQLCEILNIPFSMAKETWNTHESVLYDAHVSIIKKELAKNRNEARLLAVEELGTEDVDEETVIPIAISFDGTWAKRGFTSNHGMGFVLSAFTGKVLDYAVISKVCSQCQQNKSRMTKEEFDAWFQNHDCKGNFEGSSPSMETACAKAIWSKSLEYNVQYKFMVSDGDSKAYNAVWDVYGVCDVCNRYEKMNKNSEEYLSWKNSDEYKTWEESHMQGTADCCRVIKLDCVGHVQKRMGHALYDLHTKTGKLEDGKPIKGKQGRLTKPTINKLQKYYGNAIRNNVNKNIQSREDKNNAIRAMQREIKAGLFHCLKLPDKERHKYCPNNSWCRFKKKLSCPDKPHHLDAVFKDLLEPIYDRLSDPSLLERCLPGFTQNGNESVNSLVWIRCPKHKWFGCKRVEMAGISAALHFSTGATSKHAVMAKSNIPAGGHTVEGSIRRDQQRVQQAKKSVSDQYKNVRQAIRQSKLKAEEERVQKEGVTYKAGAFNDLTNTAGNGK